MTDNDVDGTRSRLYPGPEDRCDEWDCVHAEPVSERPLETHIGDCWLVATYRCQRGHVWITYWNLECLGFTKAAIRNLGSRPLNDWADTVGLTEGFDG